MYSDDTRAPNSNECAYNGRKMSNVITNIKASSYVDQVCIGCDDDDEFDSLKPTSNKEGRVKIGLEINIPGHEIWPEIDLEDVLVFARKHCNGIFERVYRDVRGLRES